MGLPYRFPVVRVLLTSSAFLSLMVACNQSQPGHKNGFTGAMLGANPQRTGVYDSPPLPKEPKVLWCFEEKEDFRSGPVVGGDLVYAGCLRGLVYAVDAQTGKEMWRFNTTPGLFSSPAVVEGTLYIGSFGDNKLYGNPGEKPEAMKPAHVYALDAKTGKEKWKFQTKAPVLSSPAVTEGAVYVGGLDQQLYAIDGKTGFLKWKADLGGRLLSSPAVAKGLVFIGSADGHLHALDARTGQVKWKYKAGKEIENTPTVSEGVVCVTTKEGRLYALDAANGKVKWQSAGGGTWIEIAICEGAAYIPSGGMRAANLQTGEEKWKFVLPDKEDWIITSPVIAEPQVYFATSSSIFALDRRTGKEVWRMKDDKFFRRLAVSRGALYAASAKGLWAFR